MTFHHEPIWPKHIELADVPMMPADAERLEQESEDSGCDVFRHGLCEWAWTIDGLYNLKSFTRFNTEEDQANGYHPWAETYLRREP